MTLDDLIRKAEREPTALEYIAYNPAHGRGLIKTRYFQRRGSGKTIVVTAKPANIRRLEKQLSRLCSAEIYYGRKDT